MKLVPSVGIVIVNWNKKADVLALLQGLRQLDYESYQIFVVDNASTDGSVEAIRAHHPHVNLVINTENRGGAGGFNSGMEAVLKHAEFEYIWLLDNDAAVEPDALRRLVEVMDGDQAIALAGSRILDSEERGVTVEVGAMVRRDTIGVVPLERNRRGPIDESPRDVDYVAICSALARVSALAKVGLLDERLFLFWDDMDWGLAFRDQGFRVVAVPRSVAYHPSFTERRRGVPTNFYYGIRNPLLVYTKHCTPLNRLRVFFSYFIGYVKMVTFLRLNRQHDEARAALAALRDFCANRWGKYSAPVRPRTASPITPEEERQFRSAKKILLIAGGSREETLRLKAAVEKRFSSAGIVLLVADDRDDVYRPHFASCLLLRSQEVARIRHSGRVFWQILFSRFDLVVSIDPSPFSFAVKRSLSYRPEEDRLIPSNHGYLHLHKVVLPVLVSVVISGIVTPIVFIRSFRYGSGLHRVSSLTHSR